ncbi:hypothetical protein [Sphingobium fuliginis]|uniref:Uncharacterized protein n=1 Tax=Sphingobium fuliginis ATCC 27551 TaxID=1208342 RepID=A0A5B8CAY6_SPHSA|nr:hypothetical protein [Sphingobium fuliginis]QDC36359.1 hypothetical protein FIL70_02975 [Sphingobium fuliginis ATCC 27551]
MQPNNENHAVGEDSALHTRHNIALYHRDHMRFNATLLLEIAADISREANRLKVFGTIGSVSRSRSQPLPSTPPTRAAPHAVAAI